ncbi:MAG: DUF7768 domain-containing protein [Candidatus Thorarchaeota archaeon]|jgi:hypothetical protein
MKKIWTRAVLESPYAGDVEKNRLYALACAKDMFERGEAPFASHLLYPRFLEKYNMQQRAEGLEAGLSWTPVAQKVLLYTDLGISGGMAEGRKIAEAFNIPVELRALGWRR